MGSNNLPAIQFWKIGGFSDMEDPYWSKNILTAYLDGQDTYKMDQTYTVHNLQKLLDGQTFQENVFTRRPRPIRVKPPYRLDEGTNSFTNVIAQTEKKEYESQQIDDSWRDLPPETVVELNNMLQCVPILSKTYTSFGHKKTYAIIIKKDTNEIKIKNEFRDDEIFSVREKRRIGLHMSMSFGIPLNQDELTYIREQVIRFPRPDVLTFPDGIREITNFNQLEKGEAMCGWHKLVISYHKPLPVSGGEILLPHSLESPDEIDDDFMHRITNRPYTSSEEQCPICFEILTDNALTVRNCGHNFHTKCFEAWMKKKMTCPICNAKLGKVIGNQPIVGKMEYYKDDGGIAGVNEGEVVDSYFVVKFNFPPGVDENGKLYESRRETGFLQDDAQGRILLELFKIAFKRRVMFGLGDSMRTGTYKPTFNVHLKTTRKPRGAHRHGFPDEGYFSRTLKTLEDNGVTIEDMYRE